MSFRRTLAKSARHLLVAATGLWIAVALASIAQARDLGQWGGQASSVRKWFENLMMPDHPLASCCGAADGYWADEFEMKNGRYVAIVTDTRRDGPLQRAHVAPGTRFVVPNSKVTTSPNNPTGHGWIFVMAGVVYCYLPPAGV